MEYIVLTWPEIQNLMVKEDFEEHSYLINDDKGLNDFGSSAYFIEKNWYDEVCLQ